MASGNCGFSSQNQIAQVVQQLTVLVDCVGFWLGVRPSSIGLRVENLRVQGKSIMEAVGE
jgi:hypothetical protein